VELGNSHDDGESESRASGLARVERQKDLFAGGGIDPCSPVPDGQRYFSLDLFASEKNRVGLTVSPARSCLDRVAQKVDQRSTQQHGRSRHLRVLTAARDRHPGEGSLRLRNGILCNLLEVDRGRNELFGAREEEKVSGDAAHLLCLLAD